MAKKLIKVRMVPENNPDKLFTMQKPTKGEKTKNKLS